MSCDYGLLHGQSSARGKSTAWISVGRHSASPGLQSSLHYTHTQTQKDPWFKVTQESDAVNSAPGGVGGGVGGAAWG